MFFAFSFRQRLFLSWDRFIAYNGLDWRSPDQVGISRRVIDANLVLSAIAGIPFPSFCKLYNLGLMGDPSLFYY
jgi:hypothetical protein